MEPPQFQADNLEILKAAQRQVIHGKRAEEFPRTNHTPLNDIQSSPDISQIPEVPGSIPYEENNFVGELFRKLQVLAEEEREITKEKAECDKIWAALEEKRQKLDTRLAAISRVKGKLSALYKEVEDIIS